MPRSSRLFRHMVLTAAGLAGGAIVVLVAEIRLAGMWPRLDEPDFDIDGLVGDPTAGRAPLRVVWLGDSTARGEGASDASGTLPHLVAAGLRRPVDVTVLADCGAKVEDVLRDQAPRLAGLRPDVVFVSVGTNDASHLRTRRRFRRSYKKLVAALPPDAGLVLLGVADMGGPIPRRVQPLEAFSTWRGRKFDAEVRRVARDAGATYIHIAPRTGPKFRRDRERYYAEDCFHPDDDGYHLWAQAVLDELPAVVAR